MHKELETGDFDLGPLYLSDIEIKNFTAVIDEKSIEFLIHSLNGKNKNLGDQRYVGIGNFFQNKLYLFIDPSVNDDASEEEIKARETIFGKGTIIKATPGGLTVHGVARELRLEQAQQEKNQELLKIIASKPRVSFSLIYSSGKLFLLNRGTANTELHTINNNGKIAFLYGKLKFNEKTQKFYGKQNNLYYNLNRSATKPITYFLRDALNDAISNHIVNHNPADKIKRKKNKWCYIDKLDSNNLHHIHYWEENLRFNKENFIEFLEETLYKAISLDEDEKTGVCWNAPSDMEVVLEVLKITKKYNLTLDPNKIPPYFKELGPLNLPLVCAAKRKSHALEIVKLLIEHGAIIPSDLEESFQEKAINPEALTYLKNIKGFYEAIADNLPNKIEDYLKNGIVDFKRNICYDQSPLVCAAEIGNHECLRIIFNFLVTQQILEKESGENALFKAVILGNVECVKILLDAGVNSTSVLSRLEYHRQWHQLLETGLNKLINDLLSIEQFQKDSKAFKEKDFNKFQSDFNRYRKASQEANINSQKLYLLIACLTSTTQELISPPSLSEEKYSVANSTVSFVQKLSQTIEKIEQDLLQLDYDKLAYHNHGY